MKFSLFKVRQDANNLSVLFQVNDIPGTHEFVQILVSTTSMRSSKCDGSETYICFSKCVIYKILAILPYGGLGTYRVVTFEFITSKP
jgi:hypothetical protein